MTDAFVNAVSSGAKSMTTNLDNQLREKLDDFQILEFVASCLTRHVSGDWGKIPPEDVETNRKAIEHGDRIMSVYDSPVGDVWVITDGGWHLTPEERNGHPVTTTILLPEDY